ncbi:uroporphyrinogen-III synthase [Methanolobus halotolerans]|uniref:Uroporphyrinogen-III synthase n=1 Tax=Methanolobus halotolerans TaxID=2052935 RepID=A0A4E0PYM9_9EURY|nr:uroporphyrinogen-III synthase [Methanolobus halotolerans]TGC10630.1 uroporphyrinogen-III synthase [Methanolobus halotolerans]
MTNKKEIPVIAIMRPEIHIRDSVELARSMGFEPLAVPMVVLNNMKDGRFDSFFTRVMKGETDYVIFDSASGIDFTLRKVPHSIRPQFIEALNRLSVVANSPGTKQALEETGVKVEGVPSHYSSEGLIDYLRDNVEGAVVDIARGYACSSMLIEGLRDFGATVFETIVYNLIDPDGDEQKELIESAMKGNIDVFAFTNCVIVNNFFDHAKRLGYDKDIPKVLNNSIVASMGEGTAHALRLHRVKSGVIPDNFTFEELLRASMQAYTDAKGHL